MNPDDVFVLVLAFVVGTVFVGAYMAGRNTSNLARMEVTAAIQTAKQEVGWTYERYRIEALRMDWVALMPEARREYVHTWGRPRWALPARAGPRDPDDLAEVRGR